MINAAILPCYIHIPLCILLFLHNREMVIQRKKILSFFSWQAPEIFRKVTKLNPVTLIILFTDSYSVSYTVYVYNVYVCMSVYFYTLSIFKIYLFFSSRGISNSESHLICNYKREMQYHVSLDVSPFNPFNPELFQCSQHDWNNSSSSVKLGVIKCVLSYVYIIKGFSKNGGVISILFLLVSILFPKAHHRTLINVS